MDAMGLENWDVMNIFLGGYGLLVAYTHLFGCPENV